MSRLRHWIDGTVAHIRLDRPDKYNALNPEMFTALRSACEAIERADGVQAVILTGEGKAFCAGGDIDAWGALDATGFSRRWLRDGHDAFDALAQLRVPVIAVLNGHTLGGGLELAACADTRIAEAHAKFGQPETSLGVIPGWSGTQRAVRRFGAQAVRRMVLFGETLTADQALAFGVVDRVVETGAGMQAAAKLALKLSETSPRATEIAKMMINAADGEDRERVIDSLAGAAGFAAPDLAEGVAAFRAKRKPDFGGTS